MRTPPLKTISRLVVSLGAYPSSGLGTLCMDDSDADLTSFLSQGFNASVQVIPDDVETCTASTLQPTYVAFSPPDQGCTFLQLQAYQNCSCPTASEGVQMDPASMGLFPF
jgi:hypothetical protein